MTYKTSILFSLVVFSNNLYTQNKIIYLISPPRTLSTVFLRCMHARDDMIIYFEPSQYAFLAAHKPQALSRVYNPHIPFKTYDEVKKTILKSAEKGPVFVKDPCCAAYECLYNDETFLANPNIEFCFLIRDPHVSLVSYYKAGDPANSNGFDWIIDWFVYERHYALFKKISKIRNKVPLVLSSEELAADPATYIHQFCKHMNIDFKDSMLAWPSLENTFDPLAWNEYKTLTACNTWHKNAIISTHFVSCERQYDVDQYGNPTFAEFDSTYQGVIKEIYTYYMTFYTKMYNYRIH